MVKRSSSVISSEIPQFWVKKGRDMLDLNFFNTLVVSRILAHYSWKEVQIASEEYFQTNIFINSFMDNKAFVKIADEFPDNFVDGKWRLYKDLYLKISFGPIWSVFIRSLSKVMEEEFRSRTYLWYIGRDLFSKQ